MWCGITSKVIFHIGKVCCDLNPSEIVPGISAALVWFQTWFYWTLYKGMCSTRTHTHTHPKHTHYFLNKCRITGFTTVPVQPKSYHFLQEVTGSVPCFLGQMTASTCPRYHVNRAPFQTNLPVCKPNLVLLQKSLGMSASVRTWATNGISPCVYEFWSWTLWLDEERAEALMAESRCSCPGDHQERSTEKMIKIIKKKIIKRQTHEKIHKSLNKVERKKHLKNGNTCKLCDRFLVRHNLLIQCFTVQ